MKSPFYLLILLPLLGSLYGCALTSENNSETPRLSGEEYEITYQKENFQVRERLLGQDDNWEWESFIMPELRIHDPLPDLGLDSLYPNEKYEKCLAQIKETGWCREIVQFTTAEGEVVSFSLDKNHLPMMGDYKLEKNNQILWESELVGATSGPILSTKRIGDEVAIEYIDIPDPKSGNFIHSILITSQNTVIDLKNTTGYDAVFAPNEVDKRLIFFAKEYTPEVKSLLIYDDSVVAEYDSVFNQKCCWDGPPVQILGNGKIIDFFARKNGVWYHVQAGYFGISAETKPNMP